MNVTVKGGYWSEFAGGVLTLVNQSPLKRRIAQMFARNGMRAQKEIGLEITGAAAGQAASASHKQVLARENAQGELGGKRTIETVVDVNRNTTAGDITDFDSTILAYPTKPASYPANGDGNPRKAPGSV